MNRKSLLFEAYRRNEMADAHERSKPLTMRWLGLGTAAAYRPVLKTGEMAFFDGRIPETRCMGWLVLTDKGIKAMHEHSKEFATVIDDLHKKTSYDHSYLANYMLAGGVTA